MSVGPRIAFCVSDHNDVAARVLAHGPVARFADIEACHEKRPLVDDRRKFESLVNESDRAAARNGVPIVCSPITEWLSRTKRVPMLDTTVRSIEEISATTPKQAKLGATELRPSECQVSTPFATTCRATWNGALDGPPEYLLPELPGHLETCGV